MDVCPWFKDGKCCSPLLASPTASPVSLLKCLTSSHTGCEFYVPPEGGRESAEDRSRYGSYLIVIHGLKEKPKCDCPFFKVFKDEKGVWLAACDVLGRYLTRYEVPKCVKYWRDCPFRRSVG